MYAAGLVNALRGRHPEATFFGCTGPRMRAAGVETVVDSASLSVVGLVEVIHHIPRIYGEFRKLKRAARERKPDLAILTDSPDFHLRLAGYLKKLGVPVLYLVAPQVWAWRKGRIHTIRRNVNRLACIFPFEEQFFRNHDVPATYIGHPLTRTIKPVRGKAEFLRKHGIPGEKPVVALLPGSRAGEIARHLPPLVDSVGRLKEQVTFVLATPPGFSLKHGKSFIRERIGSAAIQVIEGETWDVIAHSDLALAASGTVTIETALLGTPMITFYKVTGLSWVMGKLLVDVPFYSMVNLVAERRVVPELMQSEFTGERLAAETVKLLHDEEARRLMQQDLGEVRAILTGEHEPMERAADIAEELLNKHL
jgi:lipid-A-disaccharide synthase